jgi:hypothetical protein
MISLFHAASRAGRTHVSKGRMASLKIDHISRPRGMTAEMDAPAAPC